MFSFLKKDKKEPKIEAGEFDLLASVINRLPEQYNFLKAQTTSEFILGSTPNLLMGEFWRTTLLNQSLIKKIEQKDKSFFLKDIKVLNTQSRKLETICLDVEFHKVT